MSKNKVNRLINEIEGLMFWYRNLKVAINQEDAAEVNRSDNNIKFIFNQLDNLGLCFRTQNDIINKLNNDKDIYINDLIKSIRFYFKNEIVEGKELLAI